MGYPEKLQGTQIPLEARIVMLVDDFNKLLNSAGYSLSNTTFDLVISYCLDNNIHYIAEGARKSQLFSIEQPPVIESYKKLVNEYGLELLLPVWDLEDDFDKETLIMGYDDNRGGAMLWGKSESKCVLGIPLEEAVPEEYTNTIKKLLEELIIPDCRRQIEYKYRPKQLLYKGNGNFPFL